MVRSLALLLCAPLLSASPTHVVGHADASRHPVSISVMFPTPWYQETVDILKRHPEVSVGIHLTLNSEWKNYRWGPVLGRTAVPSLVDADGYFFPPSDRHAGPEVDAPTRRLKEG